MTCSGSCGARQCSITRWPAMRRGPRDLRLGGAAAPAGGVKFVRGSAGPPAGVVSLSRACSGSFCWPSFVATNLTWSSPAPAGGGLVRVQGVAGDGGRAPAEDRGAARAAQLATELSRPLYNAGHLSTIQRWLATLGDEAIAAWPPLAVHACMAVRGHGRHRGGGALGGDGRRRLVRPATAAMVPPRSSPPGRCCERLMCTNGPQSMLADATLALAEEPPWSPRRPNALWLLAEAHLVLGDVDEARELFDEASTVRHPDRHPTTSSSSRKRSSRCWHSIAGTRIVPSEHVRVARDVIEASGLEDYSSALLLYAAAARLARVSRRRVGGAT